MINIKCSNCGKEFDITRSKCPFCGDPVKTSCKFYCGTCESKLKFGDFICPKCDKYPDEIIIEQKNGERIKTNFYSPKNIESIYKSKIHGKYIILPNILYWFIPISLALILLIILPDDGSCSSDFMCFDFTFFDALIADLIILFFWVLFTFPILLHIFSLRKKYLKNINLDLIKKEKSTLQIKCKHCGEMINLSRGAKYCTKCGKNVDDSYKLHCGECDYYIEPGDVICSHCFDVPKEIIVETKDGKRVKTTFSEE